MSKLNSFKDPKFTKRSPAKNSNKSPGPSVNLPIIEEEQKATKVVEKTIVKEVEKVFIKEVEKIVYAKPLNKLVISNHTNNIQFIRSHEKVDPTIENIENFILVPKMQPTKSLGKSVFVRFKPSDINQLNSPYQIKLDKEIVIKSGKDSLTYKFEKVFRETDNQEKVFNDSFSVIFKEILNGFNVSVISYGEIGSGKTYSLIGNQLKSKENMGILPRILNKIFDFIYDTTNDEYKFEMKFSAAGIYGNSMYDLLNSNNSKNIKIKERQNSEVNIEFLTELYIESLEEINFYLQTILDNTNLSKESNKFYSIIYYFEFIQKIRDKSFQSKFRFVDVCESKDVEGLLMICDYLFTNKGNQNSFNQSGVSKNNNLSCLLFDMIFGNFKTFFLMNLKIDSNNLSASLETLKFAHKVNILEKVDLSTEFSDHIQTYFEKNGESTKKGQKGKTSKEKEIIKRSSLFSSQNKNINKRDSKVDYKLSSGIINIHPMSNDTITSSIPYDNSTGINIIPLNNNLPSTTTNISPTPNTVSSLNKNLPSTKTNISPAPNKVTSLNNNPPSTTTNVSPTPNKVSSLNNNPPSTTTNVSQTPNKVSSLNNNPPSTTNKPSVFDMKESSIPELTNEEIEEESKVSQDSDIEIEENEQNEELKTMIKELKKLNSRDLIEKIMTLQNENKSLQDEKKSLIKKSDIKSVINDLEYKLRSSVKKMEELNELSKVSFTEHFRAENMNLKEIIKKIESESLDDARGPAREFGCDFYNYECYSRLKVLMINLGLISGTLENNENSYISVSYTEIFKSIKLVLSEILQDYLKNVDKFKTKDMLKGQISETITIERDTYSNLKNSYTQLSMLLVYYEKILIDIMNKLIIDLKSVQLYEEYTKNSQKYIKNLNNIMTDFFDIFDKYIKLKPSDASISSNMESTSNNEGNLSKFFKTLSKVKVSNPDCDRQKIESLEEELKILNKEIRSKQLHNESLLNEIDILKKRIDQLETTMINYQNNTELAYQQVLDNHIITFDILRQFYAEEINMMKNMINGLNDIIEEFLANKDFYALDANRKKFSDCYLNKAKSFIKDIKFKSEHKKKGVMNALYEKIIIEEGTATKKLELYLKDEHQIFVESGLNCKENGKGPIARVLKINLEGDNNEDIWNVEITK